MTFNLFKIGFSIFLTSYIATFVESVPRLYLIKETTSFELGLFSPILLMLGIVTMIPNKVVVNPGAIVNGFFGEISLKKFGNKWTVNSMNLLEL